MSKIAFHIYSIFLAKHVETFFNGNGSEDKIKLLWKKQHFNKPALKKISRKCTRLRNAVTPKLLSEIWLKLSDFHQLNRITTEHVVRSILDFLERGN